MNEPTRATDAPEWPAADQAPSHGSRPRSAARLFLVPLFVVSVLVVAWWLVLRWLNADYDPHDLLRDMRAPGRSSWQKAYAFSELLQDPRHAALKEDATLCRDLAAVLDEQLRSGRSRPGLDQVPGLSLSRVGRVPRADGLPALLRAAEASHSEARIDVHCAALEALAVLAGNLTPASFANDPRAWLCCWTPAASRTRRRTAADGSRVASTATFALGVVGGAGGHASLAAIARRSPTRRALQRSHGSGASRRRRGDPRAVGNARGGRFVIARRRVRAKRCASGPTALLLSNAIHAAVRLVETNPQADRQALLSALERLGERRESAGVAASGSASSAEQVA